MMCATTRSKLKKNKKIRIVVYAVNLNIQIAKEHATTLPSNHSEII